MKQKSLTTTTWTYLLAILGCACSLSEEAKPQPIMPTRDEVPQLIKELKDKDAEVRERAAIRLRFIKPLPEQAIRPLIALLDDKHGPVRYAAIYVLAEAEPKPKEAVTALIGILENDRDGMVRARAAYALIRFGELARPAIPQLQRMFQSELPLYRSIAAQAWRGLNGDARNALASLAKSLEKSDPPSVWEMQKLPVADLIQLLHDDNVWVRADAIQTIKQRRLSSEQVISELGRIAISDREGTIRLLTTRTLGSLGAESKLAPGLVVEALRKEDWGYIYVHRAVLQGFGKRGVEALLKATKDPDATLQLKAAFVLYQCGAKIERALEIILLALKSDDVGIRRDAIDCVSALGLSGKRVDKALHQALGDKDAVVRDKAKKAININVTGRVDF